MRYRKAKHYRSNFKPLLLLLLVIVIAVTGTVLAYMFKRTDTKVNFLSPAKINCVIDETFVDDSKTSIRVTNDSNTDAYIRVKFVTYWMKDGEIAPKPSTALSITTKAGWDAGEIGTYYYTEAVAKGETVELLAAPLTLEEVDGYKQVVDVFAETIQSKPASAVTNSWGVVVDSDGRISK